MPPRLTGGRRRRPAHLFGLSVLRWVVVEERVEEEQEERGEQFS